MIGIILASHGHMAEGMLHTLKMFYGNEPEEISALCYEEGMPLEDFEAAFEETIKSMNTGSGVIILCDIVGGTPMKEGVKYLNDSTLMITGMNFNLLMDLMIKRNGITNVQDLNIIEIIEDAKSGIINVNDLMKEL